MAGRHGLRERKKIERRRAIEDAALGLFEAHGFDETTVDEIAASANIAPRTFFHYFPTKEDVVLADYAARLERITAELSAQPDTVAPWAALRAAFVTAADDYVEQHDELVRRFQIIASNPSVYARSLQLQAGWEDALADALAERTQASPDDITSRLMASSALACMRSALRHWLVTGHRSALPEVFQHCFDRLAIGFDAVTPSRTD